MNKGSVDISRLSLCIAVLLLAQGCGTIQHRNALPGSPAYGITGSKVGSPIYGGVRSDVAVLETAGEPESLAGVFCCLATPFAIIDIPFSVIADTIMLPITIPEAHRLRDKSNSATNKTDKVVEPTSGGDSPKAAPQK